MGLIPNWEVNFAVLCRPWAWRVSMPSLRASLGICSLFCRADGGGPRGPVLPTWSLTLILWVKLQDRGWYLTWAFSLPQDPVPSGFSAGEVLIPLADEYDPMFPNDYEKVVKRQREERQRQRELERQKEIEEREK